MAISRGGCPWAISLAGYLFPIVLGTSLVCLNDGGRISVAWGLAVLHAFAWWICHTRLTRRINLLLVAAWLGIGFGLIHPRVGVLAGLVMIAEGAAAIVTLLRVVVGKATTTSDAHLLARQTPIRSAAFWGWAIAMIAGVVVWAGVALYRF